MQLAKLVKIGVILVILAAILTACGGATATSAPAANPTAIPTCTPAPTAAAPAGADGPVMLGQPPISGTVETYDASAKALTVKASDGKTQKYGTANTSVFKTEKVAVADLAKYLSDSNTTLMLTGDKGSDGAYEAKSLRILDGGNMQIGLGGAPGGGAPPANMTMPANLTAPAGFSGAPPPDGLRIVGPMGGEGAGVVIRGATLSGTKLTGTSITGESVTVNLSASTSVTRQVSAKLDDLKSGLNVSVIAPPAQGSASLEALMVIIN